MEKLSTFLIVLLTFSGNQAFAQQTAEKKILWTSDWSANGKYIAIAGNLLKFIKHRPEQVLMLCVAWHKSGTFFVTGDYGYDQTRSLLQYWDEAGKLLKSIDISKGEYRNLSWNARGNKLATASDALRIWDTKGKLISEGASKDFLWGVSWNKKGNRIITSSLEQRIVLWNNKAEKLLSIE